MVATCQVTKLPHYHLFPPYDLEQILIDSFEFGLQALHSLVQTVHAVLHTFHAVLDTAEMAIHIFQTMLHIIKAAI